MNGSWTGVGDDLQRHFCVKANFKATNATDFSGTIDTFRSCGPSRTSHCTVQGQVSGLTVTTQTLICQPPNIDPCGLTLHLNATLSSMTGGLSCQAGLSITLTKAFSIQDVSQSSGISNQSVQTSGVQWIDYNNDKKLDLYLVGHNGNVLFKNIGKGKFVDVTIATKTGNNGKDASGASWADIDNDGDLDVFVANATGAPTLLLNNKTVFQDISNNIDSAVAKTAGIAILRGGIWVDINNDKKSDLFIIFDGAKNQLFKQTGTLEFNTNIASTAGVDFNGLGRSAIATDFDGDGFQDLYLVNFGQPNHLYKNNGNETFTDVTQSAGVGFNGKSVQAILSDYDNDQDLDLYVVNSAGPPVLYQNLGNFKFKNATSAVLKKAKKGAAAAFFDVDNDQNVDLIVAQIGAPNLIFENLGKGKFKIKKGIDLSRPDNPSGIAIGDFNNDGIPDIAIGDADTDQDHGDSLYQNTGGGENNYLTLVLRGTKSRRDAIGAQIVIQTGFTFQTRTITSGSGQSQESLPQQFGLGPNLKVDRIVIKWPSGTVQEIKDVSANKTLTITEP